MIIYEEFALFLNSKGILVVGNDHMGHGKSVNSEKEWGYFAEKNASKLVVKDLYHLTCIIKKRYPDCPYFLLGHSMGSFLARRYLMTYANPKKNKLTGDIRIFSLLLFFLLNISFSFFISFFILFYIFFRIHDKMS